MITAESISLLFRPSVQRKYVLAIVGTTLMALLDVVGVAATVPLMQVLTGAPTDEGLLGWVSHALGDPGEPQLAIALAVLTFGAFLIKGVAAIGFRWWFLGFVSRQEADTSTRLLKYYLDAPYGLHLRRSSADLIRTMVDAVRGAYSQVVVSMMNLISDGFTLIAVAAVLIVLVPVPALLLLGYFAVASAVMYRFIRPAAHHAGDRLVTSSKQIYQDAMHSLGGVKEIKIRHVSPYFLRSYGSGRREFADAQRTAGFIGELPKYAFEVLFILGIGGVTVFVFLSAPSAESIGVLAVLATAGFRLMPSAIRLLSAMNSVRIGGPSLDLVTKDLREAARFEATETRGVERALSAASSLPHGDVEVDRVAFTHEGRESPAVADVSFTIPAGTAIGLVGGSGAGKTTVVDLLLGLYTPTTGDIGVGGTSIRGHLPEWQRRVGLVPQEVYLLDDTLRANIAFGVDEADIDPVRLAEAVSGAQLEQLVGSFAEGLDTLVGERGARLSGGQRQRIGIARALYTRPELLVLDEATSALDNETERRIADTIAALRGQVTIVIVAHRLSTVRDCDQIVLLRDGFVEGRGTFDELRVTSAEFAHLVELGDLR